MNGKLSWSIFWALVGVFVVTVSVILIPAFRELLTGSLFLTISGAVLFLLGVALIFLTVKEKVGGMLKKFLLMMGISAGAFVVSVILHNAISGWFGVEEPVFFIIAVFLCPLGFLVGAVGSIVLAIKKFRLGKKIPSSPQ